MAGHGQSGEVPGAPGGAPGAPDGAQAAEEQPGGQDAEASPAELADELRAALLRRMIRMQAALPDGYYTEIKGQIGGADGPPLVGTFKLRDFAASIKDLAGMAKGPGADVEDLSPLAGIIGLGDEGDEAEDEGEY